MKNIYDLDYQALEQYVLDKGWKKFRAKQIFEWLYRKRVTSFEQMSDVSKQTRDVLENELKIALPNAVNKQISKDKTRKYLLELEDHSLVECVLMVHDYGNTICVSSQVGCNMGCTFCASGLLKKQRDLTSGEMVSQVLFMQKELDEIEARVSHVVIMGTGEPFDNYDNVLSFMRIVNHDLGLAIGARHITVSTCGLPKRIKQFADENVQFNLAVSLHAPNDTLRNSLMPVNKSYPLAVLFDALNYYSSKSNRRITFEYILLKGVNDTKECIAQLSLLLKGMNAYVNLIPYNEVDENGYKSTDYKSAIKFYDLLTKANVKCTLRVEHGADIDAACGQLRAKQEKENR